MGHEAHQGIMRADKWLWTARFFKTRSLASKACDLGRVEVGGQTAKASREIRTGDRLRVKTEAGDFQLDVLGLAETRGPAAAAQALYHETETSQAQRMKVEEERKAMLQSGTLPQGKPSKKDRRDRERLRGRVHPFHD